MSKDNQFEGIVPKTTLTISMDTNSREDFFRATQALIQQMIEMKVDPKAIDPTLQYNYGYAYTNEQAEEVRRRYRIINAHANK
ncbi:hypothetical protein GCM10027299_21420 [Larkinella ripae]